MELVDFAHRAADVAAGGDGGGGAASAVWRRRRCNSPEEARAAALEQIIVLESGSVRWLERLSYFNSPRLVGFPAPGVASENRSAR